MTSRACLKSDKSKSTDEQNENKITENQEIVEVDVSLILRNPETNRYHCPIKDCSASFPTRSKLKRHINGVHRNFRPFKCDFDGCSESFTLKENLDRHKATHEEDLKPVECPHCDEKFKNPKELENHIKTIHTVTDHQCPDCKKYFTSKSGLNLHIKYCKKIKVYKCPDPECEKSFVTQWELDRHMAHKHSDERNHICDFKGCGKAFKTENKLRAHKKSRHSDEKPHKCPYCKKPYKTLTPLRTHVFKKHPEKYKEYNDPKVEE